MRAFGEMDDSCDQETVWRETDDSLIRKLGFESWVDYGALLTPFSFNL